MSDDGDTLAPAAKQLTPTDVARGRHTQRLLARPASEPSTRCTRFYVFYEHRPVALSAHGEAHCAPSVSISAVFPHSLRRPPTHTEAALPYVAPSATPVPGNGCRVLS